MSNDTQFSLFGEGRMTPPVSKTAPDLQAIRARLKRLLDTLEAAETMPLADRDARMWQTVVPNMTKWLPADEAETIRLAFSRQMARLKPHSALSSAA